MKKNDIEDRLLFLDTETGGIDSSKHSLLSIGLAVWDVSGEILDTREIFIKHECYNVTSTAQKINKFNKELHEKVAVDEKEAIAQLIEFAHQYFSEDVLIPLAGHNVQFDVSFVKRLFEKNGRSYNKIFSHRTIDTYSLLKSLCFSGLIKKDLSSSASAFRYFDIKVIGRHTSLGDTIATVQLYNKMIDIISARS